MFPPVPAPFQGSTPQSRLPHYDLPFTMERCFAWLAMGAAGLICSAYWVGRSHMGWQVPIVLVCSALGLFAFAGIWLIAKAVQVPHSFATTCWEVMQERQNRPAAASQTGAMPEHPVRAWAGLLGESAARLRKLQKDRARLRAETDAKNRQLQQQREQAQRLASRLRTDGESLADAASSIMADSARLADGTQATLNSTASTSRDVEAAIGGATSLAAAVRATTGEIIGMTSIAVQAADSAFAAHRAVAALDTKTISVARAAEKIAGILHASAEAASPEVAFLWRSLNDSLEASLTDLQNFVEDSREATGTATARMAQLSEVIQGLQASGESVAHAVMQQGEQISALMAHLWGASTGLSALREGVDAVASSGTRRMAGAEAVRGAANRLPGHADAIASILRNIPDFTPPAEF